MKTFPKEMIVHVAALDLNPDELKALMTLLGNIPIEEMKKFGVTEEQGHIISRLFFMMQAAFPDVNQK